MTKEQLKQEFARWIDAGRPAVWYKSTTSNPRWLASGRQNTCWRYSDTIYIVDDEQAELRKLRIDEPDTKFQVYSMEHNKWYDVLNPDWNTKLKYRIKPEPKIERRWRYARDANGYTTIASIYMSDSFAKNSKYLENGWYKLENNYIDVLIDKENKND